MPVHFLLRQQNPFFKNLIANCLSIDATKNLKRILPYLKGKKILDIGLGAGITSKLLISQNFNVSGLDVVDISLFSDIKATLYDGIRFPYKDNQFDTGLLLHVLHHCSDQEAVLREAKKCCRRLIIIEDTYRSFYEKIITSLNDRLGNFEFFPHPYHSVPKWRQIFRKNNLKIIKKIEFYRRPSFFIVPVHYVLFVLE